MSRRTEIQTRITAHSSALICQAVDLRGDITIGAGTVIHPKATILATNGPIVIGENCVIEETAVIVNRRKEIMRIGDENHFMIGCRIESPSIGDHNTFQPKCNASSAVHISDHCTIAAGTVCLPAATSDGTEETLPPYTVIYGQASQRRLWDASGQTTDQVIRDKHIEYLREIMPKYNRMRAV